MKYITKEDFEKIFNFFSGKQLTLDTQKEIHDYMALVLL